MFAHRLQLYKLHLRLIIFSQRIMKNECILRVEKKFVHVRKDIFKITQKLGKERYVQQ